jgi:transcriptional regulator with XRE-family HTH domain
MRLPEVEARLRVLAVQHSIAELHQLADEIKRRPRKPPSKIVSARMTPALKLAIRAAALTYPQLTQLEIAETFGVSQGRVSEILRGKRK